MPVFADLDVQGFRTATGEFGRHSDALDADHFRGGGIQVLADGW